MPAMCQRTATDSMITTQRGEAKPLFLLISHWQTTKPKKAITI